MIYKKKEIYLYKQIRFPIHILYRQVLKYYNHILQMPFFRNNDLKANLIFVLGIVFFFVLAEDLGSEMAKEKDEISFYTATMTESVNSINFNTIEPLIFTPVLIAYLTIEKTDFSDLNNCTFHSGRSPPVS